MKISIVGAGMVGSMSAFLLGYENLGEEIVLVDVDNKKAKAEALDMAQALVGGGNTRIFGGGIEEIKESDIVVITAGAKQRNGEKRSELKEKNEKIMKEIAKNILVYAPFAQVLVATNPLDDMVEVVSQILKKSENLVIGTGTELDSYRFRYYLGEFFGVCPCSVKADVWGPHNEEAIFMWDRVYIGGMEMSKFLEKNGIVLDEENKKMIENKVINSAFEIIEGKGATYFAIAVVIKEVVKALVLKKKAVFNLSIGKIGSEPLVL